MSRKRSQPTSPSRAASSPPSGAASGPPAAGAAARRAALRVALTVIPIVAFLVYSTRDGRPEPAPVQTAVEAQAPAAVPVHGYEVVRNYPHDATAFTQGLLYRDGHLFESTGLEGQSTLRQVELETGRVVRRHDLDKTLFGEGLTTWNDTLVQITWRSGLALVYDVRTFALQHTFTYAGEGWGITHDGRRFILSDGDAALRFFDPKTFAETGRLPVTNAGRPVRDLNELEFVDGQVYANVWHTDRIAVIDPATGVVTAWINLEGLRPQAVRLESESVLNGIAYDAGKKRLFVTGKRWPELFEIRVRPAGGSR